MTNGDPEGQIILSYPHTNNGFFFLAHHLIPHFIMEKHEKRLPKNPDYAEMRHTCNITIMSWMNVQPACSRACGYLYFIFPENIGSPDPVYKKHACFFIHYHLLCPVEDV